MSVSTTPDVSSLTLGDAVWSPNAGRELRVVGLSYGRVPTEEVLAGRARPIEARLSADGRSFESRTWHRGDACGEEVYVERITAEGCMFHGFIDSETRHIVQAG
ncbi:MAG TPA: hypothetical protein VMF09_07180 [Solirubrobacteraceae bacterium]|jgi:hypothetical protein|nr:hypothetical protein [Solirubrobacteraceae bacterium]